MALSDLLAALELDAAAETARVRAEADAAAAGIVAAAEAEARSVEQNAARAAEAALAHELDGRRAEARLAAAALLREAREQCFRGLVTALRRRLGALREDEAYPGVFAELLAEALAALPAARVIRVDPRDERLARGLAAGLDARLVVEPSLETAGGLELVSGDGRTARNTIEERLRNAEPALRLVLGELLGGGAGAPPARTPEQALA